MVLTTTTTGAGDFSYPARRLRTITLVDGQGHQGRAKL